ncbi:MAG: DUF3224 domain-containing protein [Gemmatimonadales bacterium]
MPVSTVPEHLSAASEWGWARTARGTPPREPQPGAEAEDSTLGRMLIDKQFRGDLQATSRGQMLTATTPVQGSAGYVAIERVSGTLHGRTGSFVLQHSGMMSRGTPQLIISVVPDSGTGELAGLAGQMTIIITEGKHSYEFEYTVPPSP